MGSALTDPVEDKSSKNRQTKQMSHYAKSSIKKKKKNVYLINSSNESKTTDKFMHFLKTQKSDKNLCFQFRFNHVRYYVFANGPAKSAVL